MLHLFHISLCATNTFLLSSISIQLFFSFPTTYPPLTLKDISKIVGPSFHWRNTPPLNLFADSKGFFSPIDIFELYTNKILIIIQTFKLEKKYPLGLHGTGRYHLLIYPVCTQRRFKVHTTSFQDKIKTTKPLLEIFNRYETGFNSLYYP